MTIYFGNYSQFKNTSPWYCYEIAKQNFLQEVKLSNLLFKLLVTQQISYRISRQKNFRTCKVCYIFHPRVIIEMKSKMTETDASEKSSFEGPSVIFRSAVGSPSIGSSQTPHPSPEHKSPTLHLTRLFKMMATNVYPNKALI